MFQPAVKKSVKIKHNSMLSSTKYSEFKYCAIAPIWGYIGFLFTDMNCSVNLIATIQR